MILKTSFPLNPMANNLGTFVKKDIMCTPGKGAKAPGPVKGTGEVTEMVDAMTNVT